MPRVVLFTLLVAFILTGSLQAQRAGGMSQGRAAGVGIRSGFGGQRGLSNGFRGFPPRSGFFSRPFHPRRDGFGNVFVPYFFPYEEPYWYEEPYAEAVANMHAPPVVIQRREERQAPTPAAIPASPQVIEVPGVANAAAIKTVPPTIFILKNGERMEARRFVLTANNLSVSIDRQQRTVPLEMLDINATITANRELGIDLRIPADRNEISLSF
jgi:hypothetical protein